MILRIINVLLLSIVMASAFTLVNKRYQSRIAYNTLSQLQSRATILDKEYTKLQLEDGTYSSGLVLQDFAFKKLGLVEPDKNHIMEIK